jgi:hypothetical protein
MVLGIAAAMVPQAQAVAEVVLVQPVRVLVDLEVLALAE